MMQSDEHLTLIERHFDGSATEAEELVFQEKINTDAAFRAEAELHRALLASLRQAGRNDLKQLLCQADETQNEPTVPSPAAPARRWRLPLLLLGGLLSAGLLWRFFLQKNQPAPPATPPLELQETPPSGETAPPTPATAPPVIDKPSPPNKKPVAALHPAAFAPNLALEPMTGNSLRSTGLEMTWSEPSDDAVIYLKNEFVTVRFSGKIKTSNVPEGDFTITVFNNIAEDFYSGKPLKTLQFKVPGGSGELPFSKTTTWQARPGLYYFLLTAPGETEPAYVGKFRVEPGK